MALFQIFKGKASTLASKKPNTVEGYCYFTDDDGKFYIDTATGTGTSKRVVLNAYKADILRNARSLKVNLESDSAVSFNGSADATAIGVSGVLDVPNGGTGKSTHTSNAVLTGNGSSAVKNVATASGALYATAANGAPKFGTLPVAQGGTGLTANPSMLINLASTSATSVLAASPRPGVTGTLAVGNGGTGKTSWTQYGLVYASASTTLASLGVGTSGQVLSSKGSTGAPEWINQGSLAANTATKFAAAQTVALTGDVTGSASSQAGWSIAATLANSGVTAGNYGPSSNASPAHGGTFSVPYVTFDAKGRATAASTKTITLPTYAVFTGATSSKAGTAGLVPAPAKGQQGYFLRGDGTWYNFLDLNSTALDTISEIKAAWESADGTLQSTLEAAIGAKVSIGSNEYIKGLSISGKTITYTKGDGTTGTLTTQDSAVTQTARTTNGEFPVLVRGTSAGTGNTTTTTSFRTNTTINLSTGLITEAGVQMQRKYGTLIPYGTNIPANANLNTTTYIKVGNYYQGSNSNVATFTNCPTKEAFMMQVLSPLSTTIDNEGTGTWVYRLRILQTYTGPRYVQYVYSGATAGSFTYGEWYRTVECEADGAVGSTTTPIYLNNGRATAGSSYAKAIVGISRSGTTFTYTCIDGTTGTFTQQDNDTHYTANLLLGASGATSTSTSAVSNPYIILRENSTNRNQIQIKGGTNITVSGDDGIITISNSYTLPTASTTLGGVKTTSTVSSNSGYTACPIINGVVYYKDTNTHAVSSVNSKTGAVSLTYSDVGAAPSSHTHDDRYYTETECNARFLTGTQSGYDANTLYNAGIHMVASGSNCPSGSQYGVVLMLPYRQMSGNTIPDFGVQIFVPNGDDTTKPDSLFFRTSLRDSWRSWKEVSVVGHTHSYLPLSGGTVTGVTTFSNTTASSSTSTGAVKISGGLGVAGNIYGSKVYGAVWNDYAEYRWVLKDKATDKMPEPGRCVVENGNDSMSISNGRLQPGAKIISDTYGMCMGETEKAKTPIAVCGRVLAHPFERKIAFNVGDAVCSGPNGTVSRMTREEIMMYPERIVGTVVSKPTYKEWGPNKIPVNGRIWIQVK